MNKEIELKPCPFCGEQPIVYDNYDMNGFDVSCNNGECAFQPTNDWLMKTREAAITAWNTRCDVTDSNVGKIELKPCREAFEETYPDCTKHKTKYPCRIRKGCLYDEPYTDLWEGFQDGYQAAQAQLQAEISDLKHKLMLYATMLDEKDMEIMRLRFQLESIAATLEPIQDIDWHGKWRIKKVMETALQHNEINK